jgi:hypothetical protein
MDSIQRPRKCKDWLKSYVEWSKPRCESPETFIIWSGLWTLAAVLRRHVKVPRELMGGWEIAPNIYTVFVAPPGRARKTTSINFSDDIISDIKGLTRGPTIVTQAALLKQLAESDDSSIWLMSHELSSLIMKSKIEMFEFLTDLYDGKKHIDAATISRSVEFVERPCCNLIAATTPRWIVENMPESVIGGGFASRVVFIYEDRVRRRQLYYEGLNYEYFDKLKADLVEDLQHISDNVNGNFTMDDDAKAFMEGWYNENAEVPDADYRLLGYLERRPAHIHKVAMLLRIAYSDTLNLTLADFEEAVRLLSITERRLPQVFREIGKNVHAPDMTQIMEWVQAKQRVSFKDLRRQFSAAAAPKLLDELFMGLIQMDFMHVNGTDVVFGPQPQKHDNDD